MSKLIDKVLRIMEGVDTSLGEKRLAMGIVQEFERDYKDATGEMPLPSIQNVCFIYKTRLKSYGFNFPIIDSWLEDYEEYKFDLINEAGLNPYYLSDHKERD